MKIEKKVSVVIPTYNRGDMLVKCVKSVLESDYKSIELIIVDNCSTDQTEEQIKNLNRNEIIYIKSAINLMASGGRNKGIKVSTGDCILFLDNDNIIEKNMIKNLVQELYRRDDIGLVGPVSLNVYDENKIWALKGDYNFWTSKPRIYKHGKTLQKSDMGKVYKTCYSPNAFMVKREVIDRVGGLDKSYFAMYEEADYGYRIKKLGYSEYIVSDAITYHYGFVQKNEIEELRHLGINNTQRAFHFAKNRTIFMKKYAPKYCLPLYFLFFVHAFNMYYCIIALKYKKIDIAKSFCKGTLYGLFVKVSKALYIEP